MEHHLSRRLSMQDIDPAAEVLAHAFFEDPLCAFMLPHKDTRLKTLKKFFYLYGELNIANHRGYGVGEPLKGVAYWLSPSKTDISISVRTLGKFVLLLFSAYSLGYFKARTILKQIDRMHQKYAREPHYYLDNIGVLPSEWRKGYSSHLIRPFLEKAKVEKVAVYTDTVTRENVALYEHFGFHPMEECVIEKTGVTVWALLKPVW